MAPNVKNMNFLNWESLVPEVPHTLGGLGGELGGGVGRFLIDFCCFLGVPHRPLKGLNRALLGPSTP